MRHFLQISDTGEAKNLSEFAKALAPFRGKWVQVEVKALSCPPDELAQEKQRTLEQNNYYWGVVIPAISDYCGMSPDETHEALKEKFLTVKARLKWDKRKKIKYTKSTTQLVTKDFAAYILRIRNYFATDIDGQRYSVAGAPNQVSDMTHDGTPVYLVDPVELSKLTL
jgi:hypothetical protein